MNTKKKDIEKIINRFKEISPGTRIEIQPESSTLKLIELEKEFNCNTKDIINKANKSELEEKVINEWIDIYILFSIHKGDKEKINTIKEG